MSMAFEEYRKNTFTKWDMCHLSGLVQKLANDGFYYLNQLVICAFCGGKLTLKPSEWTETLNVREMHEKLCHCRFVQGEYVRNIPIGEDPRRKKECDTDKLNNIPGVSNSS